MAGRIPRLLILAALVLALLLSLSVLLAPQVFGDPMAQPALRQARRMLLSWLIPVFLMSAILSFALPALLVPFARSLRKQEGVGGAWLLLAVWSSYALVPTGLLLLALSSFAFTASAPFSIERKVVAIEGVTIDDRVTASLSSAIRLDATSRLDGGFISTSHGIWKLSDASPQLLIRESAGGLSDFLVRRHYLFVVLGSRLFRYDTTDGSAALTADLPMPGMRVGQIRRSFGAASNLLLWGSADGKSLVYELRADAQYAKLAESPDKIVGASACIDRTFVATPTHVLQLRLGFNPLVSFRVAEGDEVTSILARQDGLDDRDRCMLLIATTKAVYSLQNGVATLLIAGMGGNLGADEEQDLDFTLVDHVRNAAIRVSFR